MSRAQMALACMVTVVAMGNAMAQLPKMPSDAQAFDGSLFKTQAPAPAAGQPVMVDPSTTLTGEPPPPPKEWSGNVETGFNGQSGNTNVTNFRQGIHAQRKTSDNFFMTDLLYNFSKQEGVTTQNQALFNARDEVLFANSPWSIFGATNIEWDEFKAYDLLVGVYGGLGYTAVDDGQTLFKLRAGAGAVKRFGGPDDRWIPEALFGFDFNRKFTDTQSFISSLDYYPRLDQWGQYRVRARAAYEIIVDKKMGMAIRLGVQTRYDSDPGPAKRLDVNYFATLGFNF
ncbi:MAG: DUF481 domain-containing protein [Gemmataceae bacterium]